MGSRLLELVGSLFDARKDFVGCLHWFSLQSSKLALKANVVNLGLISSVVGGDEQGQIAAVSKLGHSLKVSI